MSVRAYVQRLSHRAESKQGPECRCCPVLDAEFNPTRRFPVRGADPLNPRFAEIARKKTIEILRRFDSYSGHLHFPRDWGERPVRAWLAVEVFGGILGWPIDRIVFGERFDILLIDSSLNPRVYIETKAPYSLTDSRKIDRLLTKAVGLGRRYPTIDHIVLTDANYWHRFDLRRSRRAFGTVQSAGKVWGEILMGLDAGDHV